MQYIYHYYSIHKTKLGSSIHSDGTYAIEKPITSHNDYLNFKEEVAKECEVTKEQLTICSFSLIYGEEPNVEAMRGGTDSQPNQKASSPSRVPTC